MYSNCARLFRISTNKWEHKIALVINLCLVDLYVKDWFSLGLDRWFVRFDLWVLMEIYSMREVDIMHFGLCHMLLEVWVLISFDRIEICNILKDWEVLNFFKPIGWLSVIGEIYKSDIKVVLNSLLKVSWGFVDKLWGKRKYFFLNS